MFDEFKEFVRQLVDLLWQTSGILLVLLALIVTGGFLFSFFDEIPLIDALYLAFITSLTIGYGDLTPETTLGKLVAVAVGHIGIIYFGMVVAISTLAVKRTVSVFEKD